MNCSPSSRHGQRGLQTPWWRLRVISAGGAWIDRKCARFFATSEITALVPRFNNGRNGGERSARAVGRIEGREGGDEKSVRDERMRGAAGALISV